MSEELKSCPFCGADAEIVECANTHAGDSNQRKWFSPKCFWDNCIILQGQYETREQAANAWNNRTRA